MDLALACEREYADPHLIPKVVGRDVAFTDKVLVQACPSLWFTVSQLALATSVASELTLLMVLQSLAASLWVIAKATLMQFFVVVDKLRLKREGRVAVRREGRLLVLAREECNEVFY